MRVELYNNGSLTNIITLPNRGEAIMFTQRYNRVAARKGLSHRAILA